MAATQITIITKDPNQTRNLLLIPTDQIITLQITQNRLTTSQKHTTTTNALLKDLHPLLTLTIVAQITHNLQIVDPIIRHLQHTHALQIVAVQTLLHREALLAVAIPLLPVQAEVVHLEAAAVEVAVVDVLAEVVQVVAAVAIDNQLN